MATLCIVNFKLTLNIPFPHTTVYGSFGSVGSYYITPIFISFSCSSVYLPYFCCLFLLFFGSTKMADVDK